MKLEIGKWYLNRIGELKKIKDTGTDIDEYAFYDEGGRGYLKNGKWCDDNGVYEFDLIKEVRVTIEEIEVKSEFNKSKEIIDIFYIGGCIKEMQRDCIMEEIERLQKLFEGDSNE